MTALSRREVDRTERPRLALICDDLEEEGRHRGTGDTRRRVGPTRPGLPADPVNPWNRAVHTWADVMRPRLSETEHAAYLKRVGWLAGDHAERSPWLLTTGDLAAWLDVQLWSIGTRRKVVVALRSFYGWATLAGLTDHSPLAGVSVTPSKPPGPNRLELPLAWRGPLEEWQTWLRAGARTENTIRTRRDHLSHLAQLHADPWALSEGDLARWLSQSDWSPATKRAKRSSARSFYGWALRAGFVTTNPAIDLDPIRQRRALPRPTPTDVLREAVQIADDRVRLALNLALYAGLRRAEIAGLHAQDIRDVELLIRGKGGHERLVPLHPELATTLRAELQRRRDAIDVGQGWGGSIPPADGWLFPARDPSLHITPRWLGVLVGRALGPGWTTHTIRHRFATQAYQTHRDLRAVQELLGHSRPETTARYAAVPNGALAAAVEGVGL